MKLEPRPSASGTAGRASLVASFMFLATSTSASAAAADDLPAALEQVGAATTPAAQPFELALGFRSSLFRGAGYDPFATSDVFTQASLRASWAFLVRGRFTTAAGPLFESGSADADARGTRAHLSLARLGLAVEERFAPHARARAFLRVAPAWLSGEATLLDPSLPIGLRTAVSTFALDASAGAAGRVNATSSSVGLWVTGESGYGWAAAQPMTLVPQLASADRAKAGTTTLGDLAPRGLFFRFAVALTY
ncbi:MAG: hypothetical protein JWM82_79 [Myxococcales bacterium]|nr:hypothetical protein [Myxococcales bacterium]